MLFRSKRIMEYFRNNILTKIGDYKVVSIRDYKLDTIKNLSTGEVGKTGLPSSDVIYYDCEDGVWICIRPSGTEPKIKFYFGVKGVSLDDADIKSEKLGKDIQNIVDSIE